MQNYLLSKRLDISKTGRFISVYLPIALNSSLNRGIVLGFVG